jgi:hypothetical protein
MPLRSDTYQRAISSKEVVRHMSDLIEVAEEDSPGVTCKHDVLDDTLNKDPIDLDDRLPTGLGGTPEFQEGLFSPRAYVNISPHISDNIRERLRHSYSI